MEYDTFTFYTNNEINKPFLITAKKLANRFTSWKDEKADMVNNYPKQLIINLFLAQELGSYDLEDFPKIYSVLKNR